MAGTLKPVRFKLAWQHFKVGDVITPTGVQRDWLLGNGYVELVDPAPPADQRPALLSRKAYKKLAEDGGRLFARETAAK